MFDDEKRFGNEGENTDDKPNEDKISDSLDESGESTDFSDDIDSEKTIDINDEQTDKYAEQQIYEQVKDMSFDYSDETVSEPKKKKSNKKVPMIIIACVLVIALFATCIYALTSKIDNLIESAYGTSSNSTDEESTSVEYPTIESTVSDTDTTSSSTGVVITDVSDVVSSVMPSIVAITSTTYVESSNYYDWLYGYSSDSSNVYEETGAGSGIIVEETDTELLIVTNNHVVEDADSLSIQFINDVSVEGYVKGTDANSDLAIVSIPLSDIDSDTLSQIKKATLGSSDDMEVGDGVIAIGNSLGYGQSVTTGVISAKDREITIDDNTMTVLQTDAAINGGNSGGALLNSAGEVIGINCAKYSSSSYSGSASVEGMGFAIPISSATEVINELMNRETRTIVDEDKRGSLGIYGYDVDSESAEAYSIPQGVFITEVISGGGAEAAGLAETDIITAFDGQSISSMESLQKLLQYYEEGETVTVTVLYRDGRTYSEKDVEVTLGSQDILNN